MGRDIQPIRGEVDTDAGVEYRIQDCLHRLREDCPKLPYLPPAPTTFPIKRRFRHPLSMHALNKLYEEHTRDCDIPEWREFNGHMEYWRTVILPQRVEELEQILRFF